MSHRADHGRVTSRLSTVVMVGVLAVACGGSQVTPSPSAVPASSPPASSPPATQVPTASPTTTSTPSPTVAPSPTPSTGQWTKTGSMAMARVAPQVVRMTDGRVLALGIVNSGGTTRSELWDPTTSRWQAAPDLPKARAYGALVALADGRVLLTGGRNEDGTSYSSSLLLDEAASAWTRSGLMSSARTDPAGALLPDGRVLVAGGYFHDASASTGSSIVLAGWGGSSNGTSGLTLDDVEPDPIGPAMATAEVYDPEDGRWSPTDAMRFARFGAAAVTLADGRVLIVGSKDGPSMGVAVSDRAYASAEIFDPANDTFTAAGRLPDIDRSALEAQGAQGANPVPDEDPQVTSVGSLVALDDGGAVLIGHARFWKHVGRITQSFQFDARTGTWSEIGHAFALIAEPTSKVLVTEGVRDLDGAMAARLPDGSVLVAGGAGEAQQVDGGYDAPLTADALRLVAASDTWTDLAPMPQPRARAGVVTLSDGSVLFVGGEGAKSGDTVELASAVVFAP